MKRTSRQCATLKEYREQVIGLPQSEVARRAKSHQARYSAIERGGLPRKWMWEPWLKALELNGVEFERLVRGATMAAVLKTPAAEDFPLSEVVQNPDAKVIGRRESVLNQFERGTVSKWMPDAWIEI